MTNTDRSKFIRMDANENPYGCAPAVVKTMRNLSATDISVYPDTTELIKKIAKIGRASWWERVFMSVVAV